MKRLIGLFGVLAVAVLLTTATLKPRDANAVGGLLFGQPQDIEFSEDNRVNYVTVIINKGWLNSDKFTLGITITGINGGFHEHGYQEVQLSASEVLGTEKQVALVRIVWNTDTISTSAPETYTVRTEIMGHGAVTSRDFLVE